MLTTHQCLVVQLNKQKHPNADLLSTTMVDGYSVVLKTSDWDGVDKGIWFPPDSLLDTTLPEFNFLLSEANTEGKYRVKAKKLRGVLSFGLMIPAPENAVIGEDYAEKFKVERYEPEVVIGGPSGEFEKGPNIYKSKYDIDAGRARSKMVFVDGEEVVCTEKIEGENYSAVFSEGRMWVASRNGFKKEYNSKPNITLESLIEKVGEEKAKEVMKAIESKPQIKSKWWELLDNVPQIRAFCEAYPNHLLYGELYGGKKGFKYDTNGKLKFVAFDIQYGQTWLDYDDMVALLQKFNVPICPVLYRGPFNFDKICELAEGKTVLGGGNVREGTVVRTIKERNHPKYGRSCLKWVGAGYLEKS